MPPRRAGGAGDRPRPGCRARRAAVVLAFAPLAGARAPAGTGASGARSCRYCMWGSNRSGPTPRLADRSVPPGQALPCKNGLGPSVFMSPGRVLPSRAGSGSRGIVNAPACHQVGGQMAPEKGMGKGISRNPDRARVPSRTRCGRLLVILVVMGHDPAQRITDRGGRSDCGSGGRPATRVAAFVLAELNGGQPAQGGHIIRPSRQDFFISLDRPLTMVATHQPESTCLQVAQVEPAGAS